MIVPLAVGVLVATLTFLVSRRIGFTLLFLPLVFFLGRRRP